MRRSRSLLTLAALVGIWAHTARADMACEDLKLRDWLPPYPGQGVTGQVVAPDAQGRVLGMASIGVNLLSWLSLSDFPNANTRGSDIWGYVSPSGREYAIIGFDRGTGFVDISNPVSPVVVGYIASPGTLWKEITTYGQFAYIVADQVGQGMQVVDLRFIDAGTVSLVRTVTDNGLATVHTIRVNPASGWIYLCGSNLGQGGLLPYDVHNPSNPVPGPMIWTNHYVHDVVVRTHTSGPLAGKEIAYCCCGTSGLFTVDVTNKNNLQTMGSLAYPNLSYCHYAWLTPDNATLYVGDELDELNGLVPTCTTDVISVQNPTVPFFVRTFTNGNSSIDHNPYGVGRFLFEANYRSGLRIYDTFDPLNIHEVGWFDTYPDDDNQNFNGLWGVHVMPSGVVLGSDMERGLFLFDTSPTTGVLAETPQARLSLNASPNPFQAGTTVWFTLDRSEEVRLDAFDVSGRRVAELLHGTWPAGRFPVSFSPGLRDDRSTGIYYLRLETPSRQSELRVTQIR